jgi:hypothetical protein
MKIGNVCANLIIQGYRLEASGRFFGKGQLQLFFRTSVSTKVLVFVTPGMEWMFFVIKACKLAMLSATTEVEISESPVVIAT